MKPRRKLYRADLGADSEGGFEPRREERETDANVIGSLADDGLHYPVIDLDLVAYTIPSSTPGHVHLFIDHGLPWDAYAKVLTALADAGIVQPAYVAACLERRQTFVRLPWVTKGDDPTDRDRHTELRPVDWPTATTPPRDAAPESLRQWRTDHGLSDLA